MQRALFCSLAALLFVGASASASAQELDVQNLRPVVGPNGAFSTEYSKTLDHFAPTGGLLLNYSSRPLVFEADVGDDEDGSVPIVDQQLALHALVGIGIADRLQLDLDLPLYLVNEGDAPATFSQAGVGDLRLRAKARIVGEDEGFGAGLAVDLGIPTGDPQHYIGTPGVTVGPRLILDYDFGPLLIALNSGVHYRQDGQLGSNIDLGPSLTYGAAAEFEVMRGLVLLTGDIFGHSNLNDFGASEDTPIEGLLGAKLITTPGVAITGAAGGGIASGAGSPEFRMLLGVAWAPRDNDFDQDGIPNADDECPDEPEDFDGFEDDDGCPDLDNDRDGIPDSEDACPNDPEDMDGFEDEDGCPDPDNDNDGVLDEVDECPNEPEDRDGLADEDGCPELDFDGDGVPDDDDDCPEEPEDIDGFEDEDGCPDPDNDNDGIPDDEDECPDEAGFAEEGGCPPAEQKAVREADEIKILDKIYFETGEAIIKPESFDLLKQIGLIMRSNPDVTLVEVGGHTDQRGDEADNLDLSQRRADAVRDWLVREFELDPTRLTAVGYGESTPIAEGRSEEAMAKNRRVEFKILRQGSDFPREEGVTPEEPPVDDEEEADTEELPPANEVDADDEPDDDVESGSTTE